MMETKDGQPGRSAPPTVQAVDPDSDPDFDEIDDVLDQFSANAPSSSKSEPASSSSKPEPASSSSGPGRPTPAISSVPVPTGPAENETEEEFIKRLTTEMSSVMSQMSLPDDAQTSPEDLAKMGKELEEFTHKMEAEGIKPEDLLKAILGEEAGGKLSDAAHEERDRRESQGQGEASAPKDVTEKPSTFEDTIRKTMERMENSSNKATTASQEESEEDMLANMLKALEAGGEGSEGDLSKMFLGMMEQLTGKDLLYEPMLELHQKFPAYLAENKTKLKREDLARYEKQQSIVKEIVGKFEEKGYSDDDPKCREFIWDKMQKMQEQGAPPEDLVQNPIPGMAGGDGPPDENCPTQ
jgi:peroxin-19